MPLAVGVLGALAFATELLLWAGVAVAVQAAVGGWLGWVLGLLVAVLVIVAWWGIALLMGAFVMVVAELKPDRGREPSDSGGR